MVLAFLVLLSYRTLSYKNKSVYYSTDRLHTPELIYFFRIDLQNFICSKSRYTAGLTRKHLTFKGANICLYCEGAHQAFGCNHSRDNIKILLLCSVSRQSVKVSKIILWENIKYYFLQTTENVFSLAKPSIICEVTNPSQRSMKPPSN